MPDPITITYSVVNITTCVLTTAKSLSNLRDKYTNAGNIITAICAESSSISASLSQIQSLLLRDAAHLESHFDSRPELRETFDTALTGCTVVYACLEEEIQRLQASARDADAMTWKVRCRFIWREDTMRDLLSQLRGQQMALNLLIQMLQLESLSELKQLMRDNNAMISKVAQRSRSLRETHPRIRVSSVFSTERDSVIDRASTIASTIDQTEFEFDDTIVNSRAYRRALAAAQNRPGTGRSISEPTAETAPDIEKLDIHGTPKSAENSASDIDEEADLDTSDKVSISTEKDPARRNSTPTGRENSDDAILINSSESPERKPSVGERSIDGSGNSERKMSEGGSSTGIPDLVVEKEVRNGIATPSAVESPRPNPPRVQRKPLPSGRHILMPSTSMSTLSSSSTAGASLTGKDNWDAISRTSTATTLTPSIFSTGSNPATNSSLSLPDTIDSASEPSEDDDNDCDTLVERTSSSSSDTKPTPTDPALLPIQRHLTTSETSYLSKLTILHTFIEEPISRRWPDLWPTLTALHQTHQIRTASTTHLLTPFKDAPNPPTAATLLRHFRRWSKAALPAYQRYFEAYPSTASALRARADADPAFASLTATFARTHDLTSLLRQPLQRFAAYVDTWARIASSSSSSPSTNADVTAFAEHLAAVRSACDAALRAAQHAADLEELDRRIGALKPACAGQMELMQEGRRLVRMGGLACRVGGKGAWKACRCVVLDNYLVFGRWERDGDGVAGSGGGGGGSGSGGGGGWYRKGAKGTGASGTWWWLSELMPAAQVQCSISGAPRKPCKASVLDELPRGQELWPFFVQAGEGVHLLAAGSEAERREWMDAIAEVQRM